MFLNVNYMVSIEDLIRGIIVQSGNDACIVLQRVYQEVKSYLPKN